MANSKELRYPHRIELGVSSSEADIAIVSIDKQGHLGELNSIVLMENEYTDKDIPQSKDLNKGYYLLEKTPRNPILFIVTVGVGDSLIALKSNLQAGINEFSARFVGKTIWLPLMGTGVGKLSYMDSYAATIETLNNLELELNGTTFLFSIPNNVKGKKLIENIIQEKLNNQFNQFEGNYFLSGSIWDKDDQTNRFFEEGIWENGYEEKYADEIKSSKPGDILFAKSTYGTKGTSYLRIKGVGQIIDNPGTGTELKVEWKIKDIEVNIKNLGKYRKTFARVNPDDIETILADVGKKEIIDAGLLQLQIESPVKKSSVKKSTYADLIADSVTGEDHLDISKDVLAFSKVMSAKSFKPPLAIALFGTWGSGKSFFMNKLKNKIEELSLKGKNSPYCEGVAQIHFNAWSYLDANLWASIVTQIFEGLSNYISNDTKAKEYKDDIEKELSRQLNVTKEEIQDLEKRREAVKDQITKLRKQKSSLKSTLNKNIQKIEENSFQEVIAKIDTEFKVSQKITNAIQTNSSGKITSADLKRIVPDKYWKNPIMLYERIQSNYTFIVEFLRWDKIGWNLIILGLILLVIIITPIILQESIQFLKNVDLSIPQAFLSLLVTITAMYKRAETVLQKLRPLIASFWKIKTEYEGKLEESLFNYEQQEKVLKIRIEHSKNEIESVNDKIQQSSYAKNDLEFRIDNALASEALYSFIEKRAGNEEYQQYLGIVSIIRKDFEILSTLFLEHKKENNKGEEFRKRFEKPLERIILYIDDLDRCPDERVVEVLEAVNLLMSFPLFVVVVGVDPRWVKNALLKKYKLQFARQMNGNNDSNGFFPIAPTDYLEKIFQVPFHLKEASDKSVKYMIKTISPTADSTPILDDSSETDSKEGDYQISVEDSVKIGEEVKVNISSPQLGNTDQTESLVLSEREIELMQDLSPIIGNNPRAIKRFVNVYQIVRAHEELSYNSEKEEIDFLVIMFLLALPIGPFKKLTPFFKVFISFENNQTKTITQFLNQEFESLQIKDLSRDLYDIYVKNYEVSIVTLLNMPIPPFFEHNSFIQRFTFEDIL